ncbi:TPA: hypothetical protein KEY36_003461 [Proteus mirabilis]|nr:hypothetical protein [Proteus mirabilis]
MSTNNEKIHQSKTKECSTLEDVNCSAPLRVYFHPDSETFLFPNEEEAMDIELDHNLLNHLLEDRIKSELRIEALTERLSTINTKPYDSKVLKEKESLLLGLRKEEQYLEYAINKLKGEMQLLPPMEKLPEATLLDASAKKSGIGLMELIEISDGKRGYKYTYVRSDKISSHIRRYQLNERDKKTGGKSFLTTEEYTDEDGNKRKRQVIDKEKLHSQLLTAVTNVTLYEYKLEEQAGILGEWAEDLNKSLKTSPYKGDKFEFDSQSQFMRWGYGAGLKAKANPFTIKAIKDDSPSVDGKLSAYAGLALAESKSTVKFKLPYEKGITITYPTKYGEGILGTLRLDIDIILSGSIGATMSVEAGLCFEGNRASGAPLKMTSDCDPSIGKIDVSKRTIEPTASAELGVFVGAQASLNVSGALKWKSPYATKENINKFIDLAKISWAVTAQAGIGVSGAIQFTYKGGKVRFLVTAGVCKGVGAKGLLAFDIDGEKIFTDFLPALGYMLRNVDYIKLNNIILEDDFKVFSSLALLLSMGVLKTASDLIYLYDQVDKVFERLDKSWKDKETRVALMNNILNSNGECLNLAPPESKGAAIASLITTNFWDEVSPSSHEGTACEFGARFASRKRAILLILSWAQSKRDYENIFQHLSIKLGTKSPWKENEKKVKRFLAEGEQQQPAIKYGQLWRSVPYNVEVKPSYYAENLQKLYDSLPDNNEVQINIATNELAPLVQTKLETIDSCTQFIPTDDTKNWK